MARFIFKLEAVLDQRIAREREKQLVVASIERERIDAEEDIRDHQRAIERERDELRAMLSSEQHRVTSGGEEEPWRGAVVDLAGARRQASAALRMTARAQQAVIKLAGIHRRLDIARLDLLHAATQRKAVELLRDKQYEAWRQEEKRRDIAATDEIATIRASHRVERNESEAA